MHNLGSDNIYIKKIQVIKNQTNRSYFGSMAFGDASDRSGSGVSDSVIPAWREEVGSRGQPEGRQRPPPPVLARRLQHSEEDALFKT